MSVTRREFLGAAAVQAGAMPAGSGRMVGIQVGAVSFLDEGVEAVLDNVQKLGGVNTLFVATFTYGRGIAGRQVPGQPLPDHGKQEYDVGFHGGAFTRIRPEYFRDTIWKVRAPDHGDYDVLEAVVPAAKRRGMRVICWYEDVWRGDVEGVRELQERDLHDRNANTLCFNNPRHRAFLLGLTENYLRDYDVDGVMWGSERQGAFSNALGAMHGGARNDPSKVTCFCEYCRHKGRERGIDFARVQAGYRALEQYVHGARSGSRPADGYFVGLWRLMLRYPELLAWETLWTDSLRETYQAVYQKAKSVKSSAGVGWHIWHNNSFNPIYRAEQDLNELSKYSDFLKVVMYHNCGGERLAGYVRSVGRTLYGDVPEEQLLEFHYRVLGYGREARLGELPRRGLSAEYVNRETRRAKAGLAGTKTLLWPGIDIDIPTAPESSHSTPEGTRDAVIAALDGGADGVLLSRKYSEMRLANLKGGGDGVRERG